MPRRRRRFADLEKQFRASGGVAEPGSRLAGYIEFKKGTRTIKVEKILTSAQRKRFGYAILPFGVSPADTTPKRYAAAITAYSNGQKTALGLSNTELGYETIEAATEQSENFYPALMRVFVRSADTKTNPVSGVTGKNYKRTPGATYSFPFGRTTTGVEDADTGATESVIDKVDAEDVRKSLATTVKAVAGVASVSFEPEVFRVGKQDLASPTT